MDFHYNTLCFPSSTECTAGQFNPGHPQHLRKQQRKKRGVWARWLLVPAPCQGIWRKAELVGRGKSFSRVVKGCAHQHKTK